MASARVAPEELFVRRCADELLEGEGLDRIAALAVRQAQQHARRGEPDPRRGFAAAQRLPRQPAPPASSPASAQSAPASSGPPACDAIRPSAASSPMSVSDGPNWNSADERRPASRRPARRASGRPPRDGGRSARSGPAPRRCRRAARRASRRTDAAAGARRARGSRSATARRARPLRATGTPGRAAARASARRSRHPPPPDTARSAPTVSLTMCGATMLRISASSPRRAARRRRGSGSARFAQQAAEEIVVGRRRVGARLTQAPGTGRAGRTSRSG